MAKLPIDLSGREVRAALEQAGFVFRRQSGNHMILRRDEPHARVVVPDHKQIRASALRRIVADSRHDCRSIHTTAQTLRLRTNVRVWEASAYHGRPELIVMSAEDYELLRQGRKTPYRIDNMPIEKIERITANRMDDCHVHLNALMNE